MALWQTYHTVANLTEALSLLAEYGERARIIAGGTDLLIELERGQRPDVEVLVDISRIAGLGEIALHGDTIRLGPLVTHNQVVANPLMVARALPLAQACWEVGAPQIRNRATVAGNVVTGSPANDTITPLMALNATITLTSLEGERTIPIEAFYTDLRRTVMRPEEILTAIHFPSLSQNERGVFIKLGLRRAQAISVVNVAVVLAFHGDTIQRAAIALGSVAPTVIRATVAEQALVGQSLNEAVIRQAAYLASIAPTPIDDVRSTAEYRSEMIRVLVARALRQLSTSSQMTGWPHQPPMLWGTQLTSSTLASSIQHTSGTPIETHINGVPYYVSTGHDKTLLRWLREDVGLVGTKEGCTEGECGACTVFLDGAAVMACMVGAPRAHGAHIVTIEGLAQDGELHPLQLTFIESGAVQCGYCTPGLIMAGAKLLEEYPNPTLEQIQYSISGNLCRCTGYYKIIEAFQRAAKQEGGTT